MLHSYTSKYKNKFHKSYFYKSKFRSVYLYAIGVGASIFSAGAMEFGVMGNLSTSMGGAGVALKGPFGLYYNPALIASERKVRLAYSVGVGMEQNNLDRLTNINFSEMVKTLSDVGSSMGGASSAGAGSSGGGTSSSANSVQGALKEALQKTNNSGSGGSSSGSSTNTSSDLKTLWETYKNKNNTDHSTLISNLNSSIQSSSMTTDKKNMFNNLANSVDWSNFSADSNGISSMTIKKGSNLALDQAMDNLNTIFEVIKNNNMYIKSQNGIVLQIPSGVIDESYGTIAVGMFNSTQAGVSLKGDSTKMRLIFGSDSSGGGTGTSGSSGSGSYYELTAGSDSYTIKTATKSDYDQHSIITSIQNGSAKIINSIFSLTEIPIGYAFSFPQGDGNISVGAAFKIMNGINIYDETNLSNTLNFYMNFDTASKIYTTFGIDVGAYYGMNVDSENAFSLGFVAKNINSPTFKYANAPSIVIDPQYRVGLAYNGSVVSVAFDADVLPNKVLNYSYGNRLSQVIGGGVKVDFAFVDVRAGMSYDLKQDNGVILTAGCNVLGIIDIAAEIGTKWVNYFGTPAPKYANVRVGGSLSF